MKIPHLSFIDVVDIVFVSVLVYYILLWFRGSRAFQLFKGFLFIICIFVVSKILGLYTIEWVMQQMATILLILLIVVFQPELRRGLEGLGKHFFLNNLFTDDQPKDIGVVSKLIKTVETLAHQKTGALIVIERMTGLNDYLDSGTTIDAIANPDLLIALFQKGSPLHDGAVIIRSDRIIGASCLLPLSDTKMVGNIGTRHRAALGLSEVSDALVIIVSEETGYISVAENGLLSVKLTKGQLKEQLLRVYHPTEKKKLWPKRSKK